MTRPSSQESAPKTKGRRQTEADDGQLDKQTEELMSQYLWAAVDSDDWSIPRFRDARTALRNRVRELVNEARHTGELPKSWSESRVR